MQSPVLFDSLVVCILNNQRLHLEKQNLPTYPLDMYLAAHQASCLMILLRQISEARGLSDDSTILSILILMAVDVSELYIHISKNPRLTLTVY
jgi:hypothetical protein